MKGWSGPDWAMVWPARRRRRRGREEVGRHAIPHSL
jgi:hypothetical protein